MKNTKIGFLLMLIVLSSKSFCRAANESNDYEEDEDDYDFDEYNDFDNATSSVDDYSAEEKGSPTTTPVSTTTKIPSTTTTIKTTVIPVILTKNNEEPVCPENCNCTDGTQFVDCSYLGLSIIPKIPTNAIKINLSHNNFSKLTIQDFPNKMQTRDLILAGNQFTELDNDIFGNFPHLDTLDLSENSLTTLQMNVFAKAVDLMQLNLDYNPISLTTNESFLNHTEMSQLSLKGCNLTSIPDATFTNLTGLTALNLADNDFKETINVKAFEPLKHLGKLFIPTIRQDNVYELCRVLAAIDVITTERYDISCFELVSGDKFEESTMTIAPKPNIEDEPNINETIIATIPTTTTTTQRPTTTTTTQKVKKNLPPLIRSMDNITTTISISERSEIDNRTESSLIEVGTDPETPSGNTVNISSDTVKNILIGIIIIASAGLAIGLLCRSDVLGIKTKLCRTRKRRPPPTDQVSPAEEIPLNKV